LTAINTISGIPVSGRKKIAGPGLIRPDLSLKGFKSGEVKQLFAKGNKFGK